MRLLPGSAICDACSAARVAYASNISFPSTFSTGATRRAIFVPASNLRGRATLRRLCGVCQCVRARLSSRQSRAGVGVPAASRCGSRPIGGADLRTAQQSCLHREGRAQALIEAPISPSCLGAWSLFDWLPFRGHLTPFCKSGVRGLWTTPLRGAVVWWTRRRRPQGSRGRTSGPRPPAVTPPGVGRSAVQ